MSVPVILAGVHKNNFDIRVLHHLFPDSDSSSSDTGCVVIFLAPTSVLATPAGAVETAT